MAINLFADPEPAETDTNTTIVGRFRSGHQVQNLPVSLSAFRVTSGDPEVMNEVSALLGVDDDKPNGEWDTKTDEKLQVFTEASEVDVLLHSPRAVSAQMVLWGQSGPIRTCDGKTQEDGDPCACPKDRTEHVEKAKQGKACKPNISILFSLADAPELGRFRFNSSAWSLVGPSADWERKLTEIDGPAKATLRMEQRENKDKGFSYTVVLLDGIVAMEDAED